MKLLIISDTHGNADSLRAVWEKESDADYILFAGDMVDFGFNPKETVDWFIEHRDHLFAVLGNHDEAILKNRPAVIDRTQKPKNFQELTYAALGDREYAFLSSLPHETTFTIDGIDYYLCHQPDELSLSDTYVEEQLPKRDLRAFFNERFSKKFPDSASPEKRMIWGHSHLQWAGAAGTGKLILNPGSLSYRFGSFESHRCGDYIVSIDGAISFRHVDFDTSHLYARAAEFSDPEAARLARAFFRKI